MKLEIFFSFLISNSILKSCISGMIDIQKAQISFGLSIYAGMNGLLKIFHRFMISHLYYIKLYILYFHAGIEEHDLKLRHLLRFVTGCYSLPPLGLLDSIYIYIYIYTAISIKVVHEQSGKVEYERERLLGIANKLMNFQSGSQQPFALVFDFSALLVDNLN